MEVAKFLPQERFQRIAEQIVVRQYHRSWGNQGGDTARRERSHGADCGLGVFSWHVDSDDPSHEPSMANSSWSSRAGSFTPG